eukprot:462705-Pelagomonas_calceolata.AAC.5
MQLRPELEPQRLASGSLQTAAWSPEAPCFRGKGRVASLQAMHELLIVKQLHCSASHRHCSARGMGSVLPALLLTGDAPPISVLVSLIPETPMQSVSLHLRFLPMHLRSLRLRSQLCCLPVSPAIPATAIPVIPATALPAVLPTCEPYAPCGCDPCEPCKCDPSCAAYL